MENKLMLVVAFLAGFLAALIVEENTHAFHVARVTHSSYLQILVRPVSFHAPQVEVDSNDGI